MHCVRSPVSQHSKNVSSCPFNNYSHLLFIFIFISLTSSLASAYEKERYLLNITTKTGDDLLDQIEDSELNCNFDNDLCNWVHDNQVEFTWTRGIGSTTSGQTGPPWDHTTKNKSKGHYMYIETSSPRKTGDRARLISPVVQKNGTYCLRFWHYMHGVGIHDLNVMTRGVGLGKYTKLVQFHGPWSVETKLQTNVFEDGEDWWNVHQTEFEAKEPFQVRLPNSSTPLIFEGVRGENFRGDLAIDDVSLLSSSCQQMVIDCNFEVNMCGWQQAIDDDFNWMPNKGPTQTRTTGPSRDHTLGSNGTHGGRYLYIEVSWPRTAGQSARLLSPVTYCSLNENVLFQIWYHMYGSSVGVLRIYLRRLTREGSDHVIWEQRGSQQNKWLLAEAYLPKDLKSNEDFQILIEAKRATYHQGDIAIDDILLTGCYPTDLKKFNVSYKSYNPLLEKDQLSAVGNDTNNFLDFLNCNFDQKSFCWWTKVAKRSDRYIWQTNRGNTTSELTGPRFDHTSGNGWYIYTEASTSKKGEKATLISKQISAHSVVCFTFSYHMFGKSIGKLEVATKPQGSERLSNKWIADGEKSKNDTDWKTAEIEITEPFNYYIVITAICGDDFYSDIAIDDILVVEKCNSTKKPKNKNHISSVSNNQTSISTKYLKCNFDDFTICNWTQSQTDNFDWTVSNGGRTLSFGTGPDNDHTTGSGQFAYIESSNPRLFDDKAILESPITNITSPICFIMWWHMFGIESGSIEVRQIIYSNSSLVQHEEIVLWSRHGDHGNHWNKLETNIATFGLSRFQIQAIRGSGWMGDIAIDDITVEMKECKIFNCSFDYGLCGWKQEEKNDFFNWKRMNMETNSPETGPKYDHTRLGSQDGFYIFIEASSPRFKGDNALLISPPVKRESTSKKCLKFWYHMYGSSVGEIAVYKRQLNMEQFTLGQSIWKNSRNEGDRWLMGTVDIDDDMPFEIVLEAVRGRDFQSDLAVDDISISPGPCIRCCSEINGYFLCANNLCLPLEKMCDGKDDCGDDSDESFCQGCGVSPIDPITSSVYGHVIDFTLEKEKEQTSIEHRDFRRIFERNVSYSQILEAFHRIRPNLLPSKSISRKIKKTRTEAPIYISSFHDNQLTQRRFYRTETSSEMKKITEEKLKISNEFFLKKKLQRRAILKISGGDEAKIYSWPWQAAYYVSDLSSTTPVHYFCGATLIDRYWVVTAAHCPRLGNEHSVVLGDHDLIINEGYEQVLPVEAVYLNENYSIFDDLQGDIALVKLKYPAKSSIAVASACLLRKEDPIFSPGHVCMTTGWGRTHPQNAVIERVLRQGEVPLVKNDVCQKIFYPSYDIHQKLICAGGDGSNSCRGDSGGPLVCKRDGRHYLVGITSWGDTECKLKVPGAYTRVQSYMNWIEKIIEVHKCHGN